jgi:hypothetical protein
MNQGSNGGNGNDVEHASKSNGSNGYSAENIQVLEGLEPVRVGKAFQAGDRLRFAAVPDQSSGKFMDDLFRFVAIPTTLEE